jgi:hypothetical protein
MQHAAGLRVAAGGLALVALGGMVVMTGCRVERTRGQRHQARALESILQTEGQRLSTLDAAADPKAVVNDYRNLLGMYEDLLDATINSAWAEPSQVQKAEDDLLILADSIRDLPTYDALSPDTKVNFERQFWRNRLRPHQQWRGPGWQTKREQWEELGVGKPGI